MRVIHVCAYYAPAYVYGGPTRSLHALCKAQQAHGIDVEVFTTTAAGHDRLQPSPDGRVFDGIPVRYFALSSPALLLGSDALAPALARALTDSHIVHLHGLFNRTIWDAASRVHAAGVRYVLSPRGMLEPAAFAHHRWRKRLAWHFKDRAVVRRADVLHATSSSEFATLERAEAARVIQIANPVSLSHVAPEHVQQMRARLGVADDAPLVLSLGRLHRIKRLDLVASAFVELWRSVPSARLVIAGPDEQRLQRDIEAGLGPARPAVQFLGAVDGETKDRLLAAATVLVQCSDSESFGMSIAEALACGTPVVVTRTCPWGDIDRWRCGFWVDQSPDAIAAALREIVTNPDLAREQGIAARRLAFDRFSPNRVAAVWRAVYRDLACPAPSAA